MKKVDQAQIKIVFEANYDLNDEAYPSGYTSEEKLAMDIEQISKDPLTFLESDQNATHHVYGRIVDDHPYMKRDINTAFLYITDCTLATVEGMTLKKTRTKSEFNRQISIAQKCCDYLEKFGIDPKGTRAEDIIGQQTVEAWASKFDVLNSTGG
jgi:hypothetical protein